MMNYPSDLSPQAETIRQRLQAGQQWLMDQHEVYLAGESVAASDAQFGRALAAWTELERVYRCAVPEACIWAPDGRCPENAPVTCDGCVGKGDFTTPAAQLGLAIGGVGHGL